jgi:replicative DNA helicase
MPITVGTNVALVGSPGSGKTTIAINILNDTSKAGLTTCFFSIDMHRNRMYLKLLQRISKLSRDEIYHLYQVGDTNQYVEKMKQEFGNVWFYDRSSPTVQDMRDYILEVEEATGTKVKLVMIDYFERIMDSRGLSDETAKSKLVASEIQDMVNDLDVACLTLVQPSKNSYAGGPDTPIESYTAIKGSSFLVQSMRNIVSIWRPFFNPKLKEYDKFMEIAILKNDLGELGHVVMGFDGKNSRVYNLEDIEYQEYKEYMEMKKNLKEDSNGWD